MSRTPRTLIVVAAGGAVGTLARWALFEATGPLGWPIALALIVVNVSGAFLLGWFAAHPRARRAHPLVVAFVAAGFLGSFTTFSGFTVEAVEGARTGEAAQATVFVFVSLGAGLVAAALGRVVAARS